MILPLIVLLLGLVLAVLVVAATQPQFGLPLPAPLNGIEDAIAAALLPLLVAVGVALLIVLWRLVRTQSQVLRELIDQRAAERDRLDELSVQARGHAAQIHEQYLALNAQTDALRQGLRASAQASDKAERPVTPPERVAYLAMLRDGLLLRANSYFAHLIESIHRVQLKVHQAEKKPLETSLIGQRFGREIASATLEEYQAFPINERLWSLYQQGDHLVFFHEFSRLVQVSDASFLSAFMKQNKGFNDAGADLVQMLPRLRPVAEAANVDLDALFPANSAETRALRQLDALTRTAREDGEATKPSKPTPEIGTTVASDTLASPVVEG